MARAQSARTTVRRIPDRGRYDEETIFGILDAALICHIGLVEDGQPFVIPMAFGRRDTTLFLHGATASRLLRTLTEGGPVCVTVTVLDGLVLARSGFNHSMNYRSVVVLGTARPLDGEEKVEALRVITEHLAPGRWDRLRPPLDKELRATSVLAVPIEEASAKVRTGPPKDDPEDLDEPVWAGVVPLHLTAGAPIPDGTPTEQAPDFPIAGVTVSEGDRRAG
ncbi:MAG TPA: pyridoxamine 5'-phosphate oxidase family protein [Actinomycetota bacterium]|nr:pyridoxamine 5'-phosphate oxidase family protein [Actinomycetota bacterium]